MADTLSNSDPYGYGSAAYNLAGNTAQSNLAGAGSMVQLADIINATNRAAQTSANNARLGTEGVATQDVLLNNANRAAQGLLDPQTEQMLQSGIAANGAASGMGVDSANLASAYRRALGQDISATEQTGQKNYLDLLAANPSAPIYDMSGQLVSPGTYSATANAQTNAQQTGSTGSGVTSAPSGTVSSTAAPRTTSGGIGTQPTAAQANTVPIGGSRGTTVSTVTAPLAAYNQSENYNPGGSSVFGTVGGYDMFDPSGLYSSGIMPTYGSTPDYSATNANGLDSVPGAPTNTNAQNNISPAWYPGYDYGGTAYTGTGYLGSGSNYGTMPDYSTVGADPMAGLTVDPSYDQGFEDWLASYAEDGGE